MYSCQYCGKIFKTNKSKNRHERETCPKRPGATQPLTPGNPPTQEVKTPAKKGDTSGQGGGYHCLGCGEPVRKGENPCHSCGAELDWGALEENENAEV
jgi:hypothetical protein